MLVENNLGSPKSPVGTISIKHCSVFCHILPDNNEKTAKARQVLTTAGLFIN
jgi:hypothetical protein